MTCSFVISLKMKQLIFLLSMAILIQACSEEEQLSPVPQVQFKTFVKYSDAAGRDTAVDFVFTLVDGDGDIGFRENEFNTACGADNSNLYLAYEEKSGLTYRPRKIWLEVVEISPTCDTLVYFDSVQVKFNQRMQYVEPASNRKSIEATVTYRMDDLSALILLAKTGRFEFYIRDRANNKSNIAYSADLDLVK